MDGMKVGTLLTTMVSASPGREFDRDLVQSNAPEIMELARAHRVPGPVLEVYDSLDLSAADGLRADQLAHGVSRLQTMFDLEFLSGVLQGAEIEFLVFKGPVLTTLAHHDRWERPAVDLDVLVRPSDLRRTVQILSEAGAVMLDRNWDLMLDMVIGELHLVLPSGTALDLHWNLLVKQSLRRRFTPDHAALFGTARPVELDGMVVQTFGQAETLVYACLHACISGGNRLVWLKDLEQLALGDDLSWPDVLRTAEAWGCSLQVGVMLARTQRTLGLDLEPGLIEQFIPNRLFRSVYAAIDRRWPVSEVRRDESLLRLATRSIGPTVATTLMRFASRSAHFARRRVTRAGFDDPHELFTPTGDADVEDRYYAAVQREAQSASK